MGIIHGRLDLYWLPDLSTELHNLIRRRLILPYLTGSFHSSFIEEYAGGLLMTLQKPDGGIHFILCEEVWRHCFGSLTVNVTCIHNEEAKLFTSSCDNFIQTAGIRDGLSHYVKILSVFYLSSVSLALSLSRSPSPPPPALSIFLFVEVGRGNICIYLYTHTHTHSVTHAHTHTHVTVHTHTHTYTQTYI
jgi:hypothetical protein